jgi:hypothetical protein
MVHREPRADFLFRFLNPALAQFVRLSGIERGKLNIQHHRQTDNLGRCLEYRNEFFTENRHKPASLPQAKSP